VEIQFHALATSTLDALFHSHFPNETASQLLPFTESWDPFHISSYGLADAIWAPVFKKRHKVFPAHPMKINRGEKVELNSL
jgi:hypothetical protein